jgi:histidyl-tRNA synthetase
VKFQAIKGVRDILPPESALWNRVEQTAREVFATYGYGEIRVPIFEETELFARSIGVETDVVNKEMYSFVEGTLHALSEDLPLSRLDEAVSEAWQRGEIPQTPANEKQVLRLHQAYHDILGIAARPRATLSHGDYETSAKLGRVIGDALGKIGTHLSLRPETTASVVRAYIEHGMHTRPGNVKLYYVGPMFRRERPQKGRYRQFYQIGAELLGSSDHPALDAEVIEMLLAFFDRIKLKGATLYINSIGDKNCRPAYVERLRAELQNVRDKLGADSQRRIETNPLRVLDSKLPEEQPIIDKLPRIAEHLCDACREHYVELKRQLALRGITYEENWRLVRGLDYYMRTTFEITAPGLGSQNAVCGGGRYDGLVELLGGPAATKGIGFAIGTDRVSLSLEGSLEQAGQSVASCGIDVYVAWLGAGTYPAAVALARKLREQNLAVELPASEMKFGKSLSLADRLGARFAVILGEEEIAAHQVTVKRLADGEQRKLSEADLLAYLKESRT